MRISINMRLRDGPWGGGNLFGKALAAHLRAVGHVVSHDLTDPKLDVILSATPDKTGGTGTYDHRDILRYLLFRNSKAVVVHRINNSSQSRDDAALKFNKGRIYADLVADHTVFVSRWLHDRYVEAGFDEARWSVIVNGGDDRLWRPDPELTSQDRTAPPEPRRVLIGTHHWSTNAKKGLDVYQRLDALLDDPAVAAKLGFVYIGNLPQGFRFRNATHVPTLSGAPLAAALRGLDGYVTASRAEAGPMHAIEAGLSGLPILHIESGALPEYVNGFGVSFTEANFEAKLWEYLGRLAELRARMGDFPLRAEAMCRRWSDLFEALLAEREALVRSRRWKRRPFQAMRLFFKPLP